MILRECRPSYGGAARISCSSIGSQPGQGRYQTDSDRFLEINPVSRREHTVACLARWMAFLIGYGTFQELTGFNSGLRGEPIYEIRTNTRTRLPNGIVERYSRLC
jgi:hypothetical protein